MAINLTPFGRSLVEGSKPEATGIKLTPDAEVLLEKTPSIVGKSNIKKQSEEQFPVKTEGRTVIGPKPSMMQNVLNSPVVDVLTGGMDLKKAEEESNKVIAQVAQRALKSEDIGLGAMADMANFVFGPEIKAARGIGGLAMPEKGKTRLQTAVKDMAFDPGAGVYGERLRENLPTPKNELDANIQAGAAGAGGFLAELATFNPRTAIKALTEAAAPASGKALVSAEQQLASMESNIGDKLPKIKEALKKQFPDASAEVESLTAKDVLARAKTNPAFGDLVASIEKESKPTLMYAGLPINPKKAVEAVGEAVKKEPEEAVKGLVAPAATDISNAVQNIEPSESIAEFKASSAGINKNMARWAHEGTSFSPEKRGEQEIAGFQQEVQSIYEELKSLAKTPEQLATLKDEMETFQAGYAAKENDRLRRRTGLMSTMIAGPANFPAARMQKKNASYDNYVKEVEEWKHRAVNSIKRKLKEQKIEAAGGEIEFKKQELAKLEQNQETMRAVNKIVRSKASDAEKIQAIMAVHPSLKQNHAEALLKPDFAGRLGFADYQLTNNNAKIRMMRQRIAELETKEAKPSSEIVFDGGKIVDNADLDRVQVIHDQKPAKEIIEALKSKGFRWSPENKAWQRKRTNSAMYDAQNITGVKKSEPTTYEQYSQEAIAEDQAKIEPTPTMPQPEIVQPGANGEGVSPTESAKTAIPDTLMQKGIAEEAKDHPEIAESHPELLPQIVKDELKIDPNAYGAPPAEPPKPPTAVSPGPEEMPEFNDEPFSPIKTWTKKTPDERLAEKAEYELWALDETKGVHPLEYVMRGFKIKPFSKGKEAEELSGIPKRFMAKGENEGTRIDELVSEINNQGFNFADAEEFRNALIELGSSPKRGGLSSDVQQYLKVKKNVEALEKKLSARLKPGRVRQLVNSYTGVKKQKTGALLVTTEEQFMKWVMRDREKVSEDAFMAGKQEVRSQVRAKLAAEKAEREAKQRFTPEQRKELYQKAYAKGLIIKTEGGKTKDKLQGILSYYKQATFQEIKDLISALQGSQENPSPKVLKLYGDATSDTEAMNLINKFNADWKDINDAEMKTLDPARTIEKVTGLDLWHDDNILAHNFFDVIAGADSARFDKFNAMLKELHENVGGMLKDTKASSEAMRKAEAGEPLTATEQKAVDYIRQRLDWLHGVANENRKRMGKKPIPYRKNYFTHIREHNLLIQLFKGDTDKINGLTTEQLDAIRKSDFTKPNAKFNPHALERKGEKTKYDLIGNYEKYLETMLYEIYMSPAIRHSRKFIDYSLLNQPKAFKSLSGLLDELAGKPSRLDELMKPVVSNAAVKWVRSQIAKNALIANINFNLVNLANITTSTGELGVYTLKGMRAFLGDPEMRKLAFKHSSVLKSRSSQFDADVMAINVFKGDLSKLSPVEQARVGYEQLKYLAEGMTRVIEYNNVGSTWCGAYMKGIQVHKMSPEKAIKYADNVARKTQTGYRSYELPAIMRSDTGKLFLQFQSWSFNAMNYLIYDMKLGNIPNAAKKPFTKENLPTDVEYRKFIILAATLFLVNKLYERFGLREPTSLTSATPKISFPARRIAQDIGAAITSKGEKTKKEHLVKAASSLLAPFGGAQMSRFLTGSILPKKDERYVKRNVVNLYYDALKRRSKGMLAEADNEANKQGIIIKEARKQAVERMVKEIADVYEDAALRKSKALLKKADDMTNGNDGLKARAREQAATRIKNARKKEATLLRQKAEYRQQPERSALQKARDLVGIR